MLLMKLQNNFKRIHYSIRDFNSQTHLKTYYFDFRTVLNAVRASLAQTLFSRQGSHSVDMKEKSTCTTQAIALVLVMFQGATSPK